MNNAERARNSFLRACALDVMVRKPGNVSFVSPGHGMDGALFIASAQAAAGPLFAPGARVGERIDNAVVATWAVAGCNTNLGILLLCAPIAAAAERMREPDSNAALRAAIDQVLSGLDLHDSRAAYRAIARARPGGLGNAPAEDVNALPTIGLRDAMALAASRDRIARQYRDGFAELFEIGLAASGPGFSIMAPAWDADPDAATIAAVQRIYLAWLGTRPDSHIVRKRGEALAHTVMAAAQPWRERAEAGAGLDRDPGFAAWDSALKAESINPGTSADLTVATLMIAGLARPAAPRG
jgi:triphosphoribosyl-dephospho-CoA synthase